MTATPALPEPSDDLPDAADPQARVEALEARAAVAHHESASGDPHAAADRAAATVRKDLDEERAQAGRLGEKIDALEKEAFPERPRPASPGQMVGS